MSETHAMTIRFPADVYERLRQDAFDKRVSMNDLVVACLKAVQLQTDWAEQKKAEQHAQVREA